MGQIKTDNLNELTQKRILHFLNQSFETEQFQQIKPMLESDKDYWIGDTVAQRIIEHRSQLPTFRYESLDQLQDIPGFGQDKLDDLVTLLDKPADVYFQERMQRNVLPENFPLSFAQITFENEEAFQEAASNTSLFSNLVAEQVARSLQNDDNTTFQVPLLAAEILKKSYLDIIDQDYLAPYEMANWFYAFDADNWFSYERVFSECAHYLEGANLYTDRRELRIFRGFPTNLTLASRGISPQRLPVVLNFEEKLITLWWASLFD